jgi:hypothetical protein
VKGPRGNIKIGNFLSMSGVGIYARDLIDGAATMKIDAVRVEYYQPRGGWKSAWSFSQGAAR